jgi:hypothetical protein
MPTDPAVGVFVTTTAHQDNGASTPPECVGPLAIPPALTRSLRALAEAAAVDDLVPLSVCATELTRRWSRPGTPMRAQVIHGPLEAVTPASTDTWTSSTSFRDALRTTADCRRSTVPADVMILVSPDGDRLYVECVTASPDQPTAQSWARSFLRLLSCLGSQPDAPLAAHALAGN